jgi:hypothetical protein
VPLPQSVIMPAGPNPRHSVLVFFWAHHWDDSHGQGGLVPSREEFENRLVLIALSAVIPGRVDTELFGPRQS